MFSKTLILSLGLSLSLHAATRYEAENALEPNEHSAVVVTSATASGGSYVDMKEGNLTFQVTATTAGFYTVHVNYALPLDPTKTQNLEVNGAAVGQIVFPNAPTFTTIKGASKIKLNAGANTIRIVKSWGWVQVDYIEVSAFVATPFQVAPSLVTPSPSPEAVKLYAFLQENFQKKIISGVMTNEVMLNDGNYTPVTAQNQIEMKWIKDASGKTPALVGVDFMHTTGKNSEQGWYQGYSNATLSLAESIYKQGGIPIYCWHWKDPSKTVEGFYSPSTTNTPIVQFNLNKAFVDSTTHAAWNTSSAEYKAIVADIDTIAKKLLILKGKNVPVLWRPVHEASGKWFWWGYRGAGATKALYRLMFDRMVNTHKLNNLIWVWTSDEASDALDWYPGDTYVDVVGRDFYYYPRIANHSSLAGSFEKLKEIFGGKKLVTLSENGSIPHPDSAVTDGAWWSWFMPWYGDYTMDGWAHDNTAADWNSIMNHAKVITLESMPGWSSYTPVQGAQSVLKTQVRLTGRTLSMWLGSTQQVTLEIYDTHGARLVRRDLGVLTKGTHATDLPALQEGVYPFRVVGSLGLYSQGIFHGAGR